MNSHLCVVATCRDHAFLMDWFRLLHGHYLSAAQGRTAHLSSARHRVLWRRAFAYIARVLRLHGHYLSAAQGRTAHLSAARRRVLWRRAFAYIARVLRLRRRWSALGLHLQTPRIQNLVSGITRRSGTLLRVADADSVVRPRAKPVAQQRDSNTVAAGTQTVLCDLGRSLLLSSKTATQLRQLNAELTQALRNMRPGVA